jgi:predicted RNA binding protein YcfA (HicA-like mRNA interferase family)
MLKGKIEEGGMTKIQAGKHNLKRRRRDIFVVTKQKVFPSSVRSGILRVWSAALLEPPASNCYAAAVLGHYEMKIREIIRQIENDGWFHVRTRGSHRQYHHATKPGTVTIAGHPGQDLHPKTLNSILRQAGLK